MSVTTFGLSAAPYIVTCHSTGTGFWNLELATLLISTHTVANFLGRLLIKGAVVPSTVLLVSLSLGRLLLVPVIIAYLKGGLNGLCDNLNLFIFAVYFVNSFS